MRPNWVKSVDGERGVAPVDERVVETDLEVPRAEGVDHRPEHIFAPRCVGRFVVGERRVPQAEAVVVLGGDNDIRHARVFGRLGPRVGVIQVGVEVVEILLVVLVADLLAILHPLVPRREGVDTPVDEQPEAIMREPCRIALCGSGGAHISNPYLCVFY